MVAATVEHHLRPGTLQLPALPPLALYVHLPWCLAKCPYCDFNSHEVGPKALPEQRYLAALRADLEAALPLIWGRPVVSVFIGGGTPSLFSPDAIAALISSVRSLLPLEPGCEITLEANPGTFERERFRAFAQAGVNRLSVGVQTFDDTLLQRIGRVHDAAQARAAVQEAGDSFDRFNIDLMYALPQQTLAQLHSDLDQALAFGPPHLSVYHLTIEPNTRFALHPPDDPTTTWPARCSMPSSIVRTRRGSSATRCRRSRGQAASACTTSTTGSSVTISASAQVPTASSAFRTASCASMRWREPMAYIDKA